MNLIPWTFLHVKRLQSFISAETKTTPQFSLKFSDWLIWSSDVKSSGNLFFSYHKLANEYEYNYYRTYNH